MSDFDFSDINLDFLQSTPPKKSNAQTICSPLVNADINIGQRTNNELRSKKRLEWAKKIASVDELLKEIQKLKCDKLQLQTQLKDFQKTAMDIQSLYTSEKRSHELKTKALQDLKQKYDQVDTDLVVKSLKCEQFEACLADQKDRPLAYNELVVKYLRIIHKLEGEEGGLKCFQDRSVVEDLKQYCAKYKVKLLFAASPKKPKSRMVKMRREDAAIQCELLQESPPLEKKPETKCQSTQCQVELRTQGTQHISTMTTRSTTTSCFITFRNVGTNFPETQTLPAVKDILKEFAPWQNITPISPLIDHPQISEEVRKTFKTIGTCTWLCNIRRSIDFIPRNKLKPTQSSRSTSCEVQTAQGIKQEVTTPSPSPTPNVPASQNTTTQDSQNTSGAISSQAMNGNPLLASINSTMQLSQVSSPSFHELWHIFGRMVLGLLQTTNSSSAGIAANSTMNQEAANQQQFHNWLRELYDSSVAAAATVPAEQTSSAVGPNEEGNSRCSQVDPPQQVPYTHSVGTSPLLFNASSPLSSTNIVRPQARRSLVEDIIASEEIVVDTAESNHEEDTSLDRINSQNISTEPNPTQVSTFNNTTSSSADENFFCDAITTVVDENPHSNSSANCINTEETSNSCKTFPKPHKKKQKHKILDEIQELFPEAKLSRDKQKALKRLLKSKKPKKKSIKKERNECSKSTSSTLVTNDSAMSANISKENENGDYVETAVDFLKGIIEKDVVTLDSDYTNHEIEIYAKDEDDYIEQCVKLAPTTKAAAAATTVTYYDGGITKNDNYLENTLKGSQSFDYNNSQSILQHTSKQVQMPDHTYATTDDFIPAQASANIVIPETFLFTKPAVKSKKAKYSNKKELYNSLFGESDTELDENEAETENNNVLFNSIENILTESNDYCPDTEVTISSSPLGFSRSNSPVPSVFQMNQTSDTEQDESQDGDRTITYGVVLNSKAMKSNVVLAPNAQTFDFNEPVHLCGEQNTDLTTNDTASTENISIYDVSTPILRNVEMSRMNTVQAPILFDSMDPEAQQRLDTIIDKQLEKIPLPCSGETNAASEDFPSDFEKDFELSSDEDATEMNTHESDKFSELSSADECDEAEKFSMEVFDKVVSSTTFTIAKEDVDTESTYSKASQSSGMDVESLNIQSCSQIQANYVLKNSYQCSSEENCNTYESSTQKSLMPKVTEIERTFNVCSKEQFNGKPGKSIIKADNQSKDGIAKDTFSEVLATCNVNENLCNSNYQSLYMNVEDSQLNAGLLIESYDDASEIIHQSNSSMDLEEVIPQNMVPIREIHVNADEDLSQITLPASTTTCSLVSNIETSQVEELVSATESTEEECSIIEISSDFTELEKTRDVSSTSDELMIDESDGDGDNCIENGQEPVKQHIKDEKNYNKKKNSVQVVSGALNQLKSPTCPKTSSLSEGIEKQKENYIIEKSNGETIDITTANNELVKDGDDNGGDKHKEPSGSDELNIIKKVHPARNPKNVDSIQNITPHNPCNNQNISAQHQNTNMKTPNVNNARVFSQPVTFPVALSFVPILARNVENKTSLDITYTKHARGDIIVPRDELVIKKDAEDKCQSPVTPLKLIKGEIINFQTKIDYDSKLKKQYVPDISENMPTNLRKTACKSISPPTSPVQNADNSINTTPVSSILNSSLYEEILSDSLCPIVDDVLRNTDDILLEFPVPSTKITRSGRKRKSECPPEAYPPCKRSERIKAQKNPLGQSSNVSLAPVEIGKYTRVNRTNTKLLQSSVNQIIKQPPNNQQKTKEIEKQELTAINMGFFREIDDRVSGDKEKDASSLRALPQLKKDERFLENNESELKSTENGHIEKPLSFTTFEKPIFYGAETKINPLANNFRFADTMNKPTTSKDIPFSPNHPTNFNDHQSNLSEIVDFTDNTNFLQTSDSESSSNHLPLLATPPIDHSKSKTLTVDTVENICMPQTSQNLFTSDNSSIFDYSESPQSPQYENTVEYILNTATLDIPLDLSPEYKPQLQQKSLLESLISHYSAEHYNVVVNKNAFEGNLNRQQKNLMCQYHNALMEYCFNTMNLDADILATKAVGKLQQYTIDNNLLCISILKIAKESEPSNVNENELPSIIQEMPPRHFNLPLQRLFYLCKHLSLVNHDFCSELQLKIEAQMFTFQQNDKLSLSGCHHLCQVYLIACKLQEQRLREHPARTFIAKCLYFYTIKAIIMIHEVLMWYPTALPHREERSYDRADPLITVIQHGLMCYKYDMDKPELRGKALISKLRYQYHYEAFKPTIEEVALNLVEKLKNSKFEELTFAFSLFCKRLFPIKTEVDILQAHLLPLANEYFNEALKDNTSYDIRISNLLTIISIIIKPFPLDWNIEAYLNLFSRFLTALNRSQIQEAAVCAIMRLQRFGYVDCFNRLRSFKPTYELSPLTQAMLKTFIHRKNLKFLKTIQTQNPFNLS